MRILIAFLLLSSTCYAQATAVISGPKEVAPGDLVIMDASGSDADALQWMLANSDKSFLAFDGNRKCVFASGVSGRYEFILATAKCVDGSASVATARHTLVVGTPIPGPGPQPDKPDPIIPPIPQPILSTIATAARDAGRQSQYQPGEPSRLADHFERVASQTGALSWTIPQMQAEMKTAFITTDQDASKRWEKFRQWFRTQTSWNTPEIAAEAFFEIAKGLRAVELVNPVSSSGETIKGRVEGVNGALDEIERMIGN
jgi:hypothetical protein